MPAMPSRSCSFTRSGQTPAVVLRSDQIRLQGSLCRPTGHSRTPIWLAAAGGVTHQPARADSLQRGQGSESSPCSSDPLHEGGSRTSRSETRIERGALSERLAAAGEDPTTQNRDRHGSGGRLLVYGFATLEGTSGGAKTRDVEKSVATLQTNRVHTPNGSDPRASRNFKKNGGVQLAWFMAAHLRLGARLGSSA
jgi:hypothetical protein